MKKLTKTAITAAVMATMTLGTVVSVSADNPKDAWVGSGTNYEYYDKGGNKLQNAWVKAGEDWYFLDSDGKMATSSFVRSDFYTGESEVLDKDDVNDLWSRDDFDDDSTFYFVDSQGKMVSGWVAIDSSSIYLSPNSSKESKIWYYFSTDGSTKGAMYTNAWIQSGEDWYAVGENGQMYTNAKLPGNLKDETSRYSVELTEDTDVYYVDSNGKMVKGWYKTVKADTDPKLAAYRGFNAADVFSDEGFYIYADPNTGVLAWDEWVNDGNAWYYIGTNVHIDGQSEDLLAVDVHEAELLDLRVIPNIATELHTMTPVVQDQRDANQIQPLDVRFGMLEDKVIQWTNHNEDKTEYFYLQDGSGKMLTGWHQYDDDYYLWANPKGELACNEVALVNGRYYYFNANCICDYKSLNTEADYVVKLPKKEAAAAGINVDEFVFYNTDRKVVTDLNVNSINISDLKDPDINPVDNRDTSMRTRYLFGTREVQRGSMTDLQAVLAYAAQSNGNDNINGILGIGENIEIFKLRNSTTMKSKVNLVNSIPVNQLGEIVFGAKPYLVAEYGRIGGGLEGRATTQNASPAAVTVVKDKDGNTIDATLTIDLDEVAESIQKDEITFSKNAYSAKVERKDINKLYKAVIEAIEEAGLEEKDFTIFSAAQLDLGINDQEDDVITEIIVADIPDKAKILTGNDVNTGNVIAKGTKVESDSIILVGKGDYKFTVKSSREGYNPVIRTIKVTVEDYK